MKMEWGVTEGGGVAVGIPTPEVAITIIETHFPRTRDTEQFHKEE